MKQVVIIAVFSLFVLIGGGAAAYFLILQPSEEAETAAATNVATEDAVKQKTEQPPGKKEKRSDRRTTREENAKFTQLLQEGNEHLLKEPLKADQLFQDALKEASTTDQKSKAWYGRVMAGKVLDNGEMEYQAGQNMLSLSPEGRDKANAHEAIAHGQKLRKNYADAISGYQQAADDYLKAGDGSMACTMLVEAARILRYYRQDFPEAEKTLAQASDVVEKGPIEEGREKVLKWMLCLERADTCKLAGDGAGQIFWHRAAVKYNPAWKETADWVERQIQEQGGVVDLPGQKESENEPPLTGDEEE
ncbi:MAG: hypothetical protein ACTTH3_00140 [Schwartzia sp. (in: firmicutes)]